MRAKSNKPPRRSSESGGESNSVNATIGPQSSASKPDSTAHALANVRVSMFADAFGKVPKDCELAAIIDAIRDGRYAAQVTRLRELRVKDADAYQLEKRKLPAFCVSGTAASRTEPLQHTGLLQVDLDKLNGTLDTLREQLKNDPHVAFGFVSPSGDGLKLGFAIDDTRHPESFEVVQKYFRETYALEIDPKVKDRLRLCFVSHDPDAWTRADVEPLPLPESSPAVVCEQTESDLEAADRAEPRLIVLPSGAVSISESARVIFQRIAPSRTLFWRGGVLVELVTVDGVQSLEILKPEKFRSDVEKYGNLFAWRSDGEGGAALKRSKMSLDDAKAILHANEARECLPSVASVLRCPVLVETQSGDVAILGRGYHEELGGLLIVAGDAPPQVPLDEAAKALRWLVDEFSFQDEGDRSRALAAFLTPALRIGGHIRGNIPIAAVEADLSQSGKGYLLELIVITYNELSYFVAQRAGGVGSFDESLSAAFISGRPFPNLDNLRGHIASAYLESFVTCPGLFPARVPHRGEVLVDPKRFILQMSSNGLETTRDLANRASICRIRKRHDFAYRDTLGELQRRQPYFLGCVFTVIGEWIANGKARTKETRHDFREWSQSLDWIVQHILRCAPLMDGHVEAQERTSNPALSWLRAVALAVSGENRLGVALIASELVEVCDLHGVAIPGTPKDSEEANKQAGRLLARVFKEGNSVAVDGFEIVRAVHFQTRKEGGSIEVKSYTFRKL